MKTFKVSLLGRNLLLFLVILSLILSFTGCTQQEKNKLFVFCNDALYSLSINEQMQVEKTKITDPVIEVDKGIKTKAFKLILRDPPFFFSSPLISCDMKKIIIFCRYGKNQSIYEKSFPVVLNIDGNEKLLLKTENDDDQLYAWFAKKEKKYYFKILRKRFNEINKESEYETQLWRANYDGSDKENLIKDVGSFSTPNYSEGQPFWKPPPIIESPDGENILFFFLKDNWIMNIKSREKRNITEEMRKYLGTEEACILEALFFSDSTKIIMFVVYTDKAGVWSMNIDGSDKKNLTENLKDKDFLHPFFIISPDNSKILLFNKVTNSDFLFDILIMNLDGADIKNLTEGMPKVVFPLGFIVFSPDGKKIVFTGKDKNGYSLWIMNSDGSGKKDLGEKIREKFSKELPKEDFLCLPWLFTECWYPTFSPDGKYVFFLLPDPKNWEEDKLENYRYDLWVVNQDGSEAKNLSELYDLNIVIDFRWYFLPECHLSH